MVVRWTGWDGSVWNLTTGLEGVALQPGFRGFGMPDVQNYRQEGPTTDGSTFNGFRVQKREVFLPLLTWVGSSDFYGSQSWIDKDAAFFDTMRPGRSGTLTVEAPNGSERSLECRFESDNSQAFDTDPSFVGWAPYGVTLIADDPFWYGEPLLETWGSEVPVEFFGGEPPDTMFTISTGASFTKASMVNEGQHESYIKWTIKGAFETIKVGVGSALIQIPFALGASQTAVIDTSPSDMRVMVNGVDRTSDLTVMPKFTPVPAGGKTNLTISYTGTATGTVSAELRTRYYRAW